MGEDLTDLFVDKSGKLTDRAKEMLAPIADDNTHINTIVAHSWGAVLLQNAIREGIVNPPKRVIVIGVPQRNIQDWKLLAHYTGTDVVVITNSGDRAVAGGQAADELHDTDAIGGGARRYDEGKIANEWAHWPHRFGGKNSDNLEGKVESRVVTLNRKDNWLGHSRTAYTKALIADGYLKDKDEMQQDQDFLLERRFKELREQDIQSEMQNIRIQRATLEAAAELARKQRDRDLKEAVAAIAVKACASPGAVNQADLDALWPPSDANLFLYGTAPVGGCPSQLYRNLGWRLTHGNRLTLVDLEKGMPVAAAGVTPPIPAVAAPPPIIPLLRQLAIDFCDSPESVSDARLKSFAAYYEDIGGQYWPENYQIGQNGLSSCADEILRRLILVGNSGRWWSNGLARETLQSFVPPPPPPLTPLLPQRPERNQRPSRHCAASQGGACVWTTD